MSLQIILRVLLNKFMNKSKIYFILAIVSNVLLWLSRIFIAGTIFSIKVTIPNPFSTLGFDLHQTIDLFLFNAQKVGGPAWVLLAPEVLLFSIFLLFIFGLWLYFRTKIKTRLVLAGIILSLFTLLMVAVVIYQGLQNPSCPFGEPGEICPNVNI